MVRETGLVLLERRPALRPAQLQLQGEQALQQGRALGLRGAGQLVLHPRPPASSSSTQARRPDRQAASTRSQLATSRRRPETPSKPWVVAAVRPITAPPPARSCGSIPAGRRPSAGRSPASRRSRPPCSPPA